MTGGEDQHLCVSQGAMDSQPRTTHPYQPEKELFAALEGDGGSPSILGAGAVPGSHSQEDAGLPTTAHEAGRAPHTAVLSCCVPTRYFWLAPGSGNGFDKPKGDALPFPDQDTAGTSPIPVPHICTAGAGHGAPSAWERHKCDLGACLEE